MDHQIKIRGLRIELGEIEAALTSQDSVKEAVVVAREDRPGDQRLVAYLVAESEIDIDKVHQSLQQYLPEYMIPNHILALEALPLSSNGKVNRKALPAPDLAAQQDSICLLYTSPSPRDRG